MKIQETAKELLAWKEEHLNFSSKLAKEDLTKFFAPEFKLITNDRSYDANYDNYFEFLEEFCADVESIHYNIQEYICSDTVVAIPMSVVLTKRGGKKDTFDKVLILKYDGFGKIIHWQEIYSIRK